MENEMLPLLLRTLPKEFLDIKKAYQKKDQILLLQRLHKLHGAVAYCDVPQLKGAISSLETALKNNQTSHSSQLFEELEKMVNQLIESQK